jgi:hypothetical protein
MRSLLTYGNPQSSCNRPTVLAVAPVNAAEPENGVESNYALLTYRNVIDRHT